MQASARSSKGVAGEGKTSDDPDPDADRREWDEHDIVGRGHEGQPRERRPGEDAKEGSEKEQQKVRLSPRQRAAMGLLTQGLNAAQIADQLGVSHEAVRQDLARAYRILVPEAGEGTDRRTQAVLEYVRLARDPAWTQP